MLNNCTIVIKTDLGPFFGPKNQSLMRHLTLHLVLNQSSLLSGICCV